MGIADMEENVPDDSYPPVLDDGSGCIFGRTLQSIGNTCHAKHRKRVDGLEKKMDRLTWALVIAAVTLAANLLRSLVAG